MPVLKWLIRMYYMGWFMINYVGFMLMGAGTYLIMTMIIVVSSVVIYGHETDGMGTCGRGLYILLLLLLTIPGLTMPWANGIATWAGSREQLIPDAREAPGFVFLTPIATLLLMFVGGYIISL